MIARRWTLTIELDSLDAQAETDPEFEFPFDEASIIVSALHQFWDGMLPEEVQEDIDWSADCVVIGTDSLDDLEEILSFVASRTIPKKITLRRNEDR